MRSIRDKKKWLEQLKRDGWTMLTGGKHNKLIHPLYGTVIIPKTPSDHRSIFNSQKDVRKKIREYQKI